MDLNADIHPVRLVRKQKAPNCSENDLNPFPLKKRLARPLWALNNRIVIGMPILRLT